MTDFMSKYIEEVKKSEQDFKKSTENDVQYICHICGEHACEDRRHLDVEILWDAITTEDAVQGYKSGRLA